MARIRTIKPGFFKNEELADLPAMTRLFFIGLWTQADRAGRLEDRPKRLKAEIFPYDTYDVEKGLNDLHNAGFILRYKVNVNASGRVLAPEQPVTELALIQIKNFTVHQQPNIKEAQSTIPEPYMHSAGTVPALQEQEYGKERNMERKGNSRPRGDDPSEELPMESANPPPVPPAPSMFTGGMFPGEGERNMPLPEIKVGVQIQRVRLTKRVDITADQVLGMWEVFKTEYFTGKKYYKDEEGIHAHFGNWLKEQKFTNGSSERRQSVSGSFNATNAAFDDLQRDLDAAVRGRDEDP